MSVRDPQKEVDSAGAPRDTDCMIVVAEPQDLEGAQPDVSPEVPPRTGRMDTDEFKALAESIAEILDDHLAEGLALGRGDLGYRAWTDDDGDWIYMPIQGQAQDVIGAMLLDRFAAPSMLSTMLRDFSMLPHEVEALEEGWHGARSRQHADERFFALGEVLARSYVDGQAT